MAKTPITIPPPNIAGPRPRNTQVVSNAHDEGYTETGLQIAQGSAPAFSEKL
jgi:hypothetical protein